MPDLLAVVIAAVAAFLAGGAYYALLGGQLATVSAAAAPDGRQPPWTLAAELLRCLILATVVAGLAAQGEVGTWSGGLLLGLALWVGFPLVLRAGAVIHEGTGWRLAALHGGDWLVKLPLVAVIVSVV